MLVVTMLLTIGCSIAIYFGICYGILFFTWLIEMIGKAIVGLKNKTVLRKAQKQGYKVYGAASA